MNTRITIRLSDAEARELAREAEKQGVSVSDIVRQTIVRRGESHKIGDQIADAVSSAIGDLETRLNERIESAEKVKIDKITQAVRDMGATFREFVNSQTKPQPQNQQPRPAQPGPRQ